MSNTEHVDVPVTEACSGGLKSLADAAPRVGDDRRGIRGDTKLLVRRCKHVDTDAARTAPSGAEVWRHERKARKRRAIPARIPCDQGEPLDHCVRPDEEVWQRRSAGTAAFPVCLVGSSGEIPSCPRHRCAAKRIRRQCGILSSNRFECQRHF